jgi:hypothetical protein
MTHPSDQATASRAAPDAATRAAAGGADADLVELLAAARRGDGSAWSALVTRFDHLPDHRQIGATSKLPTGSIAAIRARALARPRRHPELRHLRAAAA